MAVRNDFTAGEVLAAADLNDTFASKLDLAGGKILQIVRATDTTLRNTNSTSVVDITGLSVTITPQKSDSAVLLLLAARVYMDNATNDNLRASLRFTDSSNNAIAGAQDTTIGSNNITGTGTRSFHIPSVILMAYATPATTSAVTYKVRASVSSGNCVINFDNANQTAQLFAIEVSA